MSDEDFRRHVPKVLDMLAQIVEDGTEAARDRIAAGKEINDRALGKPVGTIVMVEAKARRAKLAQMTDDDLRQQVALEFIPGEAEYRSAYKEPPVDAEFAETRIEDDPLLQ